MVMVKCKCVKVFAVQQTCPTCGGKGKVITDPCNACHGQGRVQKTKTLNAKIPAGVDTGDRIRYQVKVKQVNMVHQQVTYMFR